MSKVYKFQPKLKVRPVDKKPPAANDPELFQQGYEHGFRSNELIDFRESFRAGFKKAKIEIREWYKSQGIYSFSRPVKFSIR